MQDRIIEFARKLQRPPADAGGFNAGNIFRLCRCRRFHSNGGGAGLAVNYHADGFIVERAVGQLPLERRQLDAGRLRRTVAGFRQGQCALAHGGCKLLRLGDFVDQLPVLGALTTHAFGCGAENVGVVMAHTALVSQAGQATGTGQHAQQRHFRQAHR